MKTFKLTFTYRTDGNLYFESKTVEAKSLKEANTLGQSLHDPDNQYWFRKGQTEVQHGNV